MLLTCIYAFINEGLYQVKELLGHTRAALIVIRSRDNIGGPLKSL